QPPQEPGDETRPQTPQQMSPGTDRVAKNQGRDLDRTHPSSLASVTRPDSGPVLRAAGSRWPLHPARPSASLPTYIIKRTAIQVALIPADRAGHGVGDGEGLRAGRLQGSAEGVYPLVGSPPASIRGWTSASRSAI